MFRNLLKCLLGGLTGCSIQTQAIQNPLWFGQAEAPPYYVVPARTAQQIHLNGQPVLLAFSPDSSHLAIATITDTSRTNEFGPVQAAELSLVSTKHNHNTVKSDLLISQDTTAPFAVYGAPAVALDWQGDNINLLVSNGDDEVTRLTYLTAEQRLQNPDIFATILQEDIAESPLKLAIARCFPDWPADVVSSGVNGINSHWLEPGKTAVYQARYHKVAEDIWYLDLQHCQRNQLLAMPARNTGPWSTHHVGTVIAGDNVLLVVRQQQIRGNGQSLLMLYSEQPPKTSLAARRWQSVNTGNDHNRELEMLGQVQQRQLFQLVNTQQPCDTWVLSLSAGGLAELQVDGHQICQAAVSAQGHLALALTPTANAADATTLADKLWLLQPGFLQKLP